MSEGTDMKRLLIYDGPAKQMEKFDDKTFYTRFAPVVEGKIKNDFDGLIPIELKDPCRSEDKM